MEAAWERREGHVSLTLEEVRRLWPCAELHISSIELIEEGKQSTNYRLETDLGRFVLRIDPKAYGKRDFATLAPEMVPTAEIYDTHELYGSSLPWRLYRWRPGVSLERAMHLGLDLPYLDIARELARVRLSLNTVKCEKAGFFDAEDYSLPVLDSSAGYCRVENGDPLEVVKPWPSAIEGLLDYLRHLLPSIKLAKGTKERITAVVQNAEPRLQAIAGPTVLVHGDFKPSNLLVDETGLTAVLDWEFAHAGTWLSDVGQLLRHPESLPEGFADAFLDELRAPPDTMLLARTLDLMNLVDFIHKEKHQPTLRREVEARIVEVCDLYEESFF